MLLQMKQQNKERFISAPSDAQTGNFAHADRLVRDRKSCSFNGTTVESQHIKGY